ncbi:hypothetical protein [Nitrosospira sp. NpAV]|uniref:hypothetical protein n=1 Tax=Nitrosospira sp. NpAV TaxID=58133 RepID=UPI0006963006|nr:hypothetical protein [Nitrosospira sp. NpAV]
MVEFPISQAASLIRGISAQFAREYPGVMESLFSERLTAELVATCTYGGYSDLPGAFRAACAEIERKSGLAGMALYHKLVLATLIADFGWRAQKGLPLSVASQYEVEFRRILEQFDTNPHEFYTQENDLFNKDLAICRGKLIPCGAELVDEFSGVPRSTAFRDGINQLLGVLWFFTARSGGFRPFYEMHMDPRSRRQFTPEGWDRCYLRVADLLEMNPQIKGLFGSSWWYDPRVEEITPNLGFLRHRPLQNGACIFRMGSDGAAIGNATGHSRRRREQYEKGEYMPTNYLMVWAREDLLRWAKQARAEGLQA